MTDHSRTIPRLGPGATSSCRTPGRPYQTQPAPAARLVLQLLENLTAAGVRVGILRGHAQFPNLVAGSDIDLAIARDKQETFASCLRDTCQQVGARVWRQDDYGHAVHYHLLCGDNDLEAPLALDVHSAETCYGIPFLTGERLLNSRPDERGLPLAPIESGTVANFLGPYLSAGFSHPIFQAQLTTLLELDPGTRGRTQGLIEDLVGQRRGSELLQALLNRDTQAIASQSKAVRRALIARAFRARPWQSCTGLLGFLWAVRMRPFLKPRGVCLAFIGTDGSGKSTLLEAVRADLADAFRGQRGARIKFRPGLLPQLDRVAHLGRQTYGPEDCRRPHRAKPSGPLISAVRALWYACDYLLGWPLRITPLRRRHGLLTLDRHYLDFLVDPERARIRRGSKLVRNLARLLPKPDAFLVCLADPQRVHDRKPELSAEECARQIQAYTELAKTWPGCHPIYTDGALEDSVAAVRRIALREVA